MEGEWVVLEKDVAAEVNLIRVGNERASIVSLLTMLYRVARQTEGFEMVSKAGPSWDDPRQRDTSLGGRMHEAMVVFPTYAHAAGKRGREVGKVAGCVLIFTGERRI